MPRRSRNASAAIATSDAAGSQNCSVFNGKASARCDYTITFGTVQCTAGETSKTFSIPIVEWNRRYSYNDVLEKIVDSVRGLGAAYQDRMRRGFRGRNLEGVMEGSGRHWMDSSPPRNIPRALLYFRRAPP